jgi:hypothetical protein
LNSNSKVLKLEIREISKLNDHDKQLLLKKNKNNNNKKIESEKGNLVL